MGKHKNRSRNRVNPTGIPSNEEVERMAENEPPTPQTSYPILALLSSEIPSEREYACMALSHLVFEDPNNLTILVQHGALKKLIQNLCDTQLEIRIAAAGALRNITIAGGPEVCDELVNKDSLTPILAIIHQVFNYFFVSQNPKTDEKTTQHTNLVEQIIPLLSYLSESNERATVIFGNSGVLPQVIQFMRLDLFPVSVAISVAQFVNVVTDANPTAAAQVISSPENIKMMQTLLNDEAGNLHLRVLLAGIAFNVRSPTPENHIFIVRSIFPVICKAIDFDGASTLVSVEPTFASVAVRVIEEEEKQESPIQQRVDDEVKSNVQKVKDQVNSLKGMMQAQQIALELLANIATEEATEDWHEEADDNTTAGSGREVNIPEEIISFIISSGVLSKVLLKCAFPPPEVLAIIQKYPPLKLDVFQPIQLRALTCIGNILLVLNLSELGNASGLWNFFCDQCTQSMSNVEVLELITAAMYTLLRKCAKVSPFAPSPQHFQGLFFVAKNSPSEDVRTNCVGMLGILGQQPQFAPVIADIGNTLLDCLNDPSVLVVAEALNSIFDVFAEPITNEVVKSLHMMNKLSSCLQVLKPKVQGGRNSMAKDTRLRAEEAVINLSRFIEYKRQQF